MVKIVNSHEWLKSLELLTKREADQLLVIFDRAICAATCSPVNVDCVPPNGPIRALVEAELRKANWHITWKCRDSYKKGDLATLTPMVEETP